MSQSRKKCPVCGKPRAEPHTPFCSSRCRDRDLVLTQLVELLAIRHDKP